MYCETNYRTKKALREAVARGVEVRLISPGDFKPATNGTEFVEGPHAPEPHTWYAEVVMRDGLVLKVK